FPTTSTSLVLPSLTSATTWERGTDFALSSFPTGEFTPRKRKSAKSLRKRYTRIFFQEVLTLILNFLFLLPFAISMGDLVPKERNRRAIIAHEALGLKPYKPIFFLTSCIISETSSLHFSTPSRTIESTRSGFSSNSFLFSLISKRLS